MDNQVKNQKVSNFNPFEEFFVIDSDNLESVQSKLYGFCIQNGQFIENEADVDENKLAGDGTYILVKRAGDKIKIYQDFSGAYGLYLFCKDEYFALSNSFVRLVDYIKKNYDVTVNTDFTNALIPCELCSMGYDETPVNEICLLDRAVIAEIDIKNKTLKQKFVDYYENTVDVSSKEGIEILDRWHDKWAKLIRNIVSTDEELQADLSGGFDSRMTFSLLASSDIDLGKVCINSAHDDKYTHSEDYEIASQIAEFYNFVLNNRSHFSKEHYNFSLEDSFNISFYTKLGFHKQMYFKYYRAKKPRFSLGGAGGESIRAYWDADFEKGISHLSESSKNYPVNARFKKSVESFLRDAYAKICKKFASFGRVIQPIDSTCNLYREGRARNHFGKAKVESFFSNTYVLSPLMDQDLNRLKLSDKECFDRNLLMTIMFDRYSPNLLDFKIQGNRKINEETIKYAKKINKMFPYSKSKDAEPALPVFKNGQKSRVFKDLEKPEVDLPNKLLKQVFLKEDFRKLFSKLYDDSVYDKIYEQAETKNFFPLENVYVATAICKVLNDQINGKNSKESTVAEFVLSFLNSKNNVTLRHHPWLYNYITGRVDVFFTNSKPGDLEMFEIKDDFAMVETPKWMIDTSKCGYVIHSTSGKLCVKLRANIAGDLIIFLRGKDVRDDKGNRIPFWLDYTKFTVNGEVVFSDLHSICHDKPYKVIIKAEKGTEIELCVEWQPHDPRKPL